MQFIEIGPLNLENGFWGIHIGEIRFRYFRNRILGKAIEEIRFRYFRNQFLVKIYSQIYWVFVYIHENIGKFKKTKWAGHPIIDWMCDGFLLFPLRSSHNGVFLPKSCNSNTSKVFSPLLGLYFIYSKWFI
jgi:hypothetical protein